MTQLDSVKYFDSILIVKRNGIEVQNVTIASQNSAIDSLNAIISNKSSLLTLDNHTAWDDFLSVMHDLRVLLINKEILVFVIGCAIMGFIIISVDWITFLAGGKDRRKLSLLSKKYSDGKSIFRNYLIWGIGSGLLAYVTTALGMFKCNFPSCVVIAVIWPTLFPKLIEKINKEQEEPVQQGN